MDEKNGALWLGMELLKRGDSEKVRRPLPTEKRGRDNTLLKCKHEDEGKLFNTKCLHINEDITKYTYRWGGFF
jgi:hypothetical protein